MACFTRADTFGFEINLGRDVDIIGKSSPMGCGLFSFLGVEIGVLPILMHTDVGGGHILVIRHVIVQEPKSLSFSSRQEHRPSDGTTHLGRPTEQPMGRPI